MQSAFSITDSFAPSLLAAVLQRFPGPEAPPSPKTEARSCLRLLQPRESARADLKESLLGDDRSPHFFAFDLSNERESSGKALCLAYELTPRNTCCRKTRQLRVCLSAAMLPDASKNERPLPLPGLQHYELSLHRLSPSGSTAWDTAASEPVPGRYVAMLPLEKLRAGLARMGAGISNTFSLAHLFHRRLRITLELCDGAEVLARDETQVELYDTGRLGSLYRRVLERLVLGDTAAQATRRGLPSLPEHFHPWYPVLTIGMDKARLYLEAIQSDGAHDTAHLPDPRWLMRVGLYLELLTCLGIIEAVRPEYPDLLSPEERHAVETTPALLALREHLDVEAWREVWALRHIARPSLWLRRVPVGPGNLLRKQRATLAFLEVHHEDLKRAISLAGPARAGAPETWRRVFLDAERAVLRNVDEVFPELQALPTSWRAFALCHQHGDFRTLGFGQVPRRLSRLLGDRDGVLASACRHYRRSMNEVAHWARERGWMHYAGEECIPHEASLIEKLLAGQEISIAS